MRRSAAHRFGLVVTLLVLLAGSTGPAVAKEPKGLGARIDALIEALQAAGTDDTAFAKAVADAPDVDRWLLAERLVQDGLLALAHRIAPLLAPEPAKALPTYLAENATRIPAEKEQLLACLGHFEAQRYKEVRETTTDLGDELHTVSRILMLRMASYARGRLRDVPGAVAAGRRAAEAAARIGWATGAARAYMAIERYVFRSGDMQGAVELGVAMRAQAVKAGRPTLAADADMRMAAALIRLGRTKDALSRAQSALEVYEHKQILQGQAEALHVIGQAYYASSSFARAIPVMEKGIKVWDRIGDRRRGAHSRANLAVAQMMVGRYAEALETLKPCADYAEAVGDQRMLLAIRINVASVHDYLGNFAESLATMKQVSVAARQLGDKKALAIALVNIGRAYHKLKQFAKARDPLVEGTALLAELEINQNLLGSRLILFDVRRNLGEVEDADAEFAALKKLAEATESREALATLARYEGDHHFERGDYAKALPHHERAANLFRRIRATREHVAGLRALAATQLKLGRAAVALATIRQALPKIESLVGGLSDVQGARSRGQFGPVYELGFAAARSADRPDEAVFFLESSRAGALLELLGTGDAIRDAVLPPALRKAEREAKAAEAKALAGYRSAVRAGRRALIRDAGQALDAARSARTALRTRLEEEAKELANVLYPQAATLDEIQDWLGANDALVLYAVHATDAYGVVVTPDAVRVVALGSAAELVAACEALAPTDPETAQGKTATRLADLIWMPLKLGSTVQRVYISPDGPLAYLPFRLFDPAREIALVPSASTLGILKEQESRRGKGVLALGAPTYLGAPVRVGQRSAKLAPLPASKAEVEAIGDLVLTAGKASVSGFQTAIGTRPRWRSIHFACHGLLDESDPLGAALALTPDDTTKDGLLTVQTVFRTRIRTDLVGLSACETGRGRMLRAEGLMGLTRAFMTAGAPRVLCSLWRVDDAATSELMRIFYAHYAPKDPAATPKSAAESLRLAQAHIRAQEKWQHPYYWAAWVIWGLA